MTYSVNMGGHVEGATPDETKAKEAAIIDRVRRFAAELEGVVSASVSASQHGHVDVHGPHAEAAPDVAAADEPVETG